MTAASFNSSLFAAIGEAVSLEGRAMAKYDCPVLVDADSARSHSVDVCLFIVVVSLPSVSVRPD